MARGLRQRAVHRSSRPTRRPSRTSCAERRAHRSARASLPCAADAARVLGDRQPREGRGGSGDPERELMLGLDRDDGIARVTRVIKIGGRAQADPALAWRCSAQAVRNWRRARHRARRRRRGDGACSGGSARSRRSSTDAASRPRRTSTSCAWCSPGPRTSDSSAAAGRGRRRGRHFGRGRRAAARRRCSTAARSAPSANRWWQMPRPVDALLSRRLRARDLTARPGRGDRARGST